MMHPRTDDGRLLRGHEREHMPLSEVRAQAYPKLGGGATLGTICEYHSDASWVVITDLPDRTWGEVFDESDDRADEKVVRFLNLELLPDAKIALFEDCVGCYEHADTARLFTDHDSAGNFVRRSDFHEKFRVLGPLHPDERSKRGRSE